MHQKLMQAQQLIHSIDQMASQLRQQEAYNRQIMSQMEQKEAQAANNLQRIQQMCQECSQIMQSTVNMSSPSNYGQTYQNMSNYQPSYSSGMSTMGMSTTPNIMGMSGNTIGSSVNLSNTTHSSPSSSIGTKSGSQTSSAYPGQFTSGMNMEISSLPTAEPFASTANMSPSKYLSAKKQLGNPGSAF
ncbi:MAG: hypothetical protein WAO24_05905 [Peptococcia bacterium]